MKHLSAVTFTTTILLSLLLLSLQPGTGRAQDDSYIRSDRLGIAHISSVTRKEDSTRYQRALRLGAGWNRWPLYWDRVQPSPDTWNWDGYDEQVKADLQHGLRINAILMGTPGFNRDGNRIRGIQEPIFADGSDRPGAGKELNPNNPWVRYVQQAVERYKSGGVLARQGEIPPGSGIRVWEIWNEPDYAPIWQAPVIDYARLLKISYIVIKQADPQAKVMFGGLLFPDGGNFLAEVLNIFVNDPMHEEFNWYMDIVAVHSYAEPARSGWLTLYTRQTMLEFGFTRPIWLNETGVPVWNDYPGPTWAPDSTDRATLQQQAWYFIQSTAYAWEEGAEKVFLHQLYDDCGDQPAGTDFPPNNGGQCGDSLCYGDAHGVYRNPRDAACFTQHPQPGTARPLARAYRLMADVFSQGNFVSGDDPQVNDNRFTVLTFDRTTNDERLVVMWNRTLQEATLELPAAGNRARLVSMNSDNTIQPRDNGTYQITLPPAQDDVDRTDSGRVAIGGEPYIMIETVIPDIATEVFAERETQDGPTATPQPMPTMTPGPTSPAPAAVDPSNDTKPPRVSVAPLPETSPSTFTVEWEGSDDSGIDHYIIWVRVDDGEWEPWLNTSATSGEFQGEPGKRYAFAAWAVDLADNWSENVNLSAQATTRIEPGG